jgi:prephenate dehydrogenase
LAAAKPDAVITDVGSVKAPIVAAAGGDPRFIGSHPMAGSEQAGVDAADVDLFQGATWALTPTSSETTRAYRVVKYLAEAIGAHTRTLNPDDHDAKSNLELPNLSAGSFASATRVAASSPSLWLGITLENKTALSETLRNYRHRLEEIQNAIDSDDADKIIEIYAQGHEARSSWQGK